MTVENAHQKELTIEEQMNAIHLVLQHFDTEHEGHVIGDHLQLKEIPAPLEGEKRPLKVGQFYMRDPRGAVPEFHALIQRDQLPKVAEMVHRFHLPVGRGADLLPQLTEADLRDEEFVVERTSTPTIILIVFLLLLAAASAWTSWQHFAPHERSATVEEMFLQAGTPPVQQAFLSWLFFPDHSRQLHVALPEIRFVDERRAILADGSFLLIENGGDMRAHAARAEEARAPLTLTVRADTSGVVVKKMTVGHEVISWSGDVSLLGKFPPVPTAPARAEYPPPSGFIAVKALPYDDEEVLKPLADQRISVTGQVTRSRDHRVLKFLDGSAIILNPLPPDSPLEFLLSTFEGDERTKVTADLIFTRLYPFEDKKNPEQSRRATRLVGEGDVQSASVQDFHVVGR